MAIGCPAKCAKFLLIVFNIIFWLSGAALLAIGIWLRVDSSILQRFGIFVGGNDQLFEVGAYVMIGVGAFIFITGFLGCCGAIRENTCMLGTYIFLLVLVMLVEIAVAVLAFVFRNQIREFITEDLIENIRNETYGTVKDNMVEYTAFGTGLNLFQNELKCCGVEGPGDWDNSISTEIFDGDVPYACCALIETASPEKPQREDLEGETCTPYPKGCEEGLIEWLEKNALILIGLGIGIACLEIFGIIFGVCVCRNPSYDD